MVDRDKIDNRLGGGDNKSESSSSDPDPIERRSYTKHKDKKSKKQKVEEFKKGSGVDTADPDVDDGVPLDDAEEVLKAIANMTLYVEGKLRAVESPENARERYMKEIADVMYDQFTDIISEKEVQLIAEKYGIDWQGDIVEGVLKEQDYGSQVGLN